MVPYFTDASLLLPALGDPPCIILGPGEPSMAHQTDEYCLLSRLAEAEQLYGDIIRDWMASPPATKVKNDDTVTESACHAIQRLNNIAE